MNRGKRISKTGWGGLRFKMAALAHLQERRHVAPAGVMHSEDFMTNGTS